MRRRRHLRKLVSTCISRGGDANAGSSSRLQDLPPWVLCILPNGGHSKGLVWRRYNSRGAPEGQTVERWPSHIASKSAIRPAPARYSFPRPYALVEQEMRIARPLEQVVISASDYSHNVQQLVNTAPRLGGARRPECDPGGPNTNDILMGRMKTPSFHRPLHFTRPTTRQVW